ncbi:helix-turn-helix domain-containing protein [Ornithinimicrobium sp. LYQ103]|uniref:helix-turn-helix domain-containing protein n=1 Tax=Ornithinimicrobium sp. LYQ103 TaxID=3378796 RepID=UPI003855318A
MKVHERLDQELSKQGKTQAALAEAVGVSSATVSQWRSGTKTPSATNMMKVAGFLGVQPSWLSYGELGATTKTVDPKQRDAYRRECVWYHRPAPQDAGRELGNAAGFAFHGGLSTLGRETCQNILDEAQPGQPTVEARYTLIEVSGVRLDNFLEAIKFDDLKPHLEAAADSRQKVAAVIRRGLTALADDGRLILLRVEDYGAKGLVGPEYDDGNYMAVVRNILDSFKGDNAGGSYGLGKSVMWACSQFGMVLINSTLSVAQDGKREGRYIGRLELPWHRLTAAEAGSPEAYAGPAWFGEKDEARGGVTRSYWGNEALALDTYLARDEEEPGTSFLIVGAYDPDERFQTIEEMHDELVNALAANFWPAMVERAGDDPGMMTALVRSERNGVTIKSDLVDPHSYTPAKARMLQVHRDDLTVDSLEQPGDVVRRRITLEVPKRLSDGGHGSQQHEAVLLVTEADEDETANRVAFLRGTHMVIREELVAGLRMGSRTFHAVVLAGLAAGDEPADKAADRFLRAAEPPAHDDWRVTPDVSSSYARGYGTALRDFKNEVRQAIREIVGRPTRDLSDGPDALKELLRISPPTVDTTKRPRVKSAVGKPDAEGRWSLDVRVSLPAREAPWRFSPVLRFGTESGAAIPVVWEELVPETKCTVTGDVVVAEAGAREVRFRGTSKADTHPVDASLATALVDVRVYKETSK